MDSIDVPVFIVGGSRTGSELLKNIIYLNTDIDMVPEMWLLTPFWINKSFLSYANLKSDSKIDQFKVNSLIDLVFSKKCQSAFWQNIEKMEVDENELKQYLLSSERECGEFFGEVLRLRAKARNKRVMGAKFPLHFAYTELLIKWFPNCKIIHTIRDPRASYASQLIKHKKVKKGLLRQKYSAILQFIHIVTQYRWQVKIHKKLSQYPNYLLFKYEDFVGNPEFRLRELCEFLQVEYKDSMLSPTIKNTSHGINKSTATKISKDSILSWKTILSPVVSKIIVVINKRAMTDLDY